MHMPKVQTKVLFSGGFGHFLHPFWSSFTGLLQRTCLGQKSNFQDPFFFQVVNGGGLDLLSVFLT